MQISIESVQLREQPYQLFLDYFKNDETKRKYNGFLFRFLKLIPTNIYPDNGIKAPKSQQIEELAKSFVELAKKDQKIAQNIIAEYIKEDKKRIVEKKLNPNTLPNYIKPIKTLLIANDILLNWKNLNRLFPREQKTDDRAYTREELQMMIEASPEITDKLIVQMFSSGGFRLEAWDYFTWKDVEMIKSEDGIIQGASLVVYRGDPEEYTTFITPEACQTLEHYKEVWKGDVGECPSPKDPLIKTVKYVGIRRLNSMGVKRRLEKIVSKIGLRPILPSGVRRHEIALVHGFRKYFNTMLRLAKVDYLDKEDMMGHKVGLESHYERYRDESERFSEYQKAIPFLTISDDERLKLENEKLKEEKSEKELLRAKLDKIQEDLDKVKQWREISLKFEKKNIS